MNQPHDSRRRDALRGLGMSAVSLAWPTRAPAQDGVARIFVGSPAGSVPDLVARRVAERLPSWEGRPLVIENRAGAAGQLAIAALRTAPADGTAMLLAPGAIATMYPAIYPKLPFDPDQDLAPVSVAAELSLAFAVGPSVPGSVRSVKDFVAWSKSSGEPVNFGSPGVGTPPHVLGMLFAARTGVTLTHVPYQGGPPAITDLLGGRLAAVFLPEGLLRQHASAGGLRLLAGSGAQRSRFLPDLATFAEQGLPDVVLVEWFAFFMPGGTTPVIRERSAQTLRHALANEALAATFSGMSMVAAASSPAQMAERIATQRAHWAPVIRAAGIRLET